MFTSFAETEGDLCRGALLAEMVTSFEENENEYSTPLNSLPLAGNKEMLSSSPLMRFSMSKTVRIARLKCGDCGRGV